MSEPILTVIMSCYNQAEYIRQALDSVLMQKTDFPFKLVITDDHSTKDNSREIIKEYAARYPDKIVALLNEENVRYLANILRVKSNMHTEYFTLLDADDYWTDENYLQDAVDFLKRHNDFTIYCRGVLWQQENGEGRQSFYNVHSEVDFDFQDYIKGKALIAQTTGAVFRNVIYMHGVPQMVADSLGTIHENVFHGDFSRFVMHLAKGKAHYVPKQSGVYRILSSGTTAQSPTSIKYIYMSR